MTKAKTVAKFIGRRLTPFPFLFDLGRNVVGSVQRTGQAFAQLSKAGETAKKAPNVAAGDWHSLSPEAKFLKSYEDGNWTLVQLQLQSGRIRVAKFVLLLASPVLVLGGIAVFLFAPWWMAAFIAPAIIAISVISLAQALRHAWWGYQIEYRSMITFREFISLKDMWKYLFV